MNSVIKAGASALPVFSIPAYIAAIFGGSLVVSVLLTPTLFGSGPETFTAFVNTFLPFVLVIDALMGAACLIIFLPGMLFILWMARRFGWNSHLHFMALGAILAVSTVLIATRVLDFVYQYPSIKRFFSTEFRSVYSLQFAVLVIWAIALSGAFGGLLYRWLAGVLSKAGRSGK